ncbi:MAG: hypothetical protein VW935_09265 [Novosphingobium sp.]
MYRKPSLKTKRDDGEIVFEGKAIGRSHTDCECKVPRHLGTVMAARKQRCIGKRADQCQLFTLSKIVERDNYFKSEHRNHQPCAVHQPFRLGQSAEGQC